MTDKKQALLPVTQADREAAADLAKSANYSVAWVRAIRDGRHDNMRSVQAFARHRVTCSPPSGDVGMLVEKLRERAAQIPGEIAERENEAESHCGAYGTSTAEDYMDDEDVLLMHDAADMLAALQSHSLPGDVGTDHRVDMANVGEALMEAIRDYSGHSFMEHWHPADCPSEIVGDIIAREIDAPLAAHQGAGEP